MFPGCDLNVGQNHRKHPIRRTRTFSCLLFPFFTDVAKPIKYNFINLLLSKTNNNQNIITLNRLIDNGGILLNFDILWSYYTKFDSSNIIINTIVTCVNRSIRLSQCAKKIPIRFWHICHTIFFKLMYLYLYSRL